MKGGITPRTEVSTVDGCAIFSGTHTRPPWYKAIYWWYMMEKDWLLRPILPERNLVNIVADAQFAPKIEPTESMRTPVQIIKKGYGN
jgi:hypothetical protein